MVHDNTIIMVNIILVSGNTITMVDVIIIIMVKNKTCDL